MKINKESNITKDDLYITEDINIYKALLTQRLNPLVLGRNIDNDNIFYIYEKNVVRQVVDDGKKGNEVLQTINRKDLFYCGSKNLFYEIIKYEDIEILAKGKYINPSPITGKISVFSVFEKRMVKDIVDEFSKNKKKYKQILNDLRGKI